MLTHENFVYEAAPRMEAEGYKLNNSLSLDGQIHRIGKGKNQWYIGGESWLVAGDWQGRLQRLELTAHHYKLSQNERVEINTKIELMKQQREHAQELAAKKAVQLLESCRADGVSKYLQRKKVKAYGISFGYSKHYNCGFIAIPLRDKDDKIYSLQRIYDEKVCGDGKSDKSFLKGGRKQDCFFTIGNINKGPVIIYCEGYATGASIHEATGHPVVVCFDCGNLEPVVLELRKHFNYHTFLIAGDDDALERGE